MIARNIMGFFTAVSWAVPAGLELEAKVDLAVVDWASIPTERLGDVCARARLLAAKNNYPRKAPADTGDVLKAWATLLDEEERVRHRAARSGLAEPKLADLPPASRNEFIENMYRMAGFSRDPKAREAAKAWS